LADELIDSILSIRTKILGVMMPAWDVTGNSRESFPIVIGLRSTEEKLVVKDLETSWMIFEL
jgi:hypothetical protein